VTPEPLPPVDQASGDEDEGALLWRRHRVQPTAALREKLFLHYLPFARRVAARHFRRRTDASIEFPDLCQMASEGLLEALDHYDPTLGTPFEGFAVSRVSGSILDGLAKLSEFREQLTYRSRMRRERARSILPAEADKLPVTEAFDALVELAVGLALGFMLEGTGIYVAEEQQDSGFNAYETLVWKEAVGRVEAELRDLPEKESTVIRCHYVDGLTFEQVGRLLGISKGRVSQIHKEALLRLRKRLPRFDNINIHR
jgi:RNA polymerase sigma factor for flagellar operon FliA